MAKTNGLKAAMEELRKNYPQVLKEAVQYATKEAKREVYNKAITCLEEYYMNYSPSSYDRTDSLRRSFRPYMNIRSNNTHIISTVGVEYNTSLLDTYTVGSNNYGNRDIDNGKEIIPIEVWVMHNYLDGIHPTTDGSSEPGLALYIPIQDSVSPTDKMEEYLINYTNTFDNNVYSYLAAYILK